MREQKGIFSVITLIVISSLLVNILCENEVDPFAPESHSDDQYVDDSYYQQAKGGDKLDMRDDSIDGHDYGIDQAETDKLKMALVTQYFHSETATWTMDAYFPVAIQFFVRDSWDHYKMLEERFKGSHNLNDWELGVQATVHVTKKYLTIKFSNQESVSREQAIEWLDMDAFDTWANGLNDDDLQELNQYMPEKYNDTPPEPTEAEMEKYTNYKRPDHEGFEQQEPPKMNGKDMDMADHPEPKWDDTYLTPEEEAEDDSEVHKEAPQDDPEQGEEYLNKLRKEHERIEDVDEVDM